MNKAVTDVITGFKSRTINSLKDQQSALTPYLDPNIVEGRVLEYLFNSNRTLPEYHEAVFRFHYMYLKNLEPRRYVEYSIIDSPIEYLVADNIIDPFLLFLDGRMVPWAMINVIMSHETYFVKCHSGDEGWQNLFDTCTRVDVIHLNDGCVYADFPIGDVDNKIFGFDSRGYYTDDPDCPISIVDESNHMVFNNFMTTGTVNAHPVSQDTTIKYYPNNVILFRNSLLDISSKISFESTLLTINDGVNPDEDMLNFTVFRDIRTRATLDNISRANLNYIKPFIESQNAGQDIPEYMTQLEEEFDFEMSRKKDYQTNVDETINKIITYNASLFEDAYLQEKQLEIEERDGQWVADNTREDGCLYIPRKHGEFTEEYIVMLVNGIMYPYYYMTKYTHDYCIIPIMDIATEDLIDLMRFKDVNNNQFDMLINKDDPYQNYDENYINDTMVLFSTIPPEENFVYPADGLQHFPVEYKILHDENGGIKITLTDERYYGKPLKLAYKYQFKHYWFDIVQSTASDQYCVDLGTKFMYCNDYSKYMVFFNGRRLSTDQYRLCLPVRATTPFYRFELYLTMLVSTGDRVDVIYTPSLLKDVILLPSIGTDGKITVDKSDITYSLNKNLYMVWANGKKISSSCISNIDSTHIKITTDIETTQTVCVTKFLPDIDELTNIFQTSTALWDTIIASLTDEEIEQILAINDVTLTNTEPDIYANTVPVRAIMLELIREKYIMNAGVDITQPFTYGYNDVDDTASSGYDSAGNAMLDSNDANISENIDGVDREWP